VLLARMTTIPATTAAAKTRATTDPAGFCLAFIPDRKPAPEGAGFFADHCSGFAAFHGTTSCIHSDSANSLLF